MNGFRVQVFTTGCNVLTIMGHFMVKQPAFETLFQLTGKNDLNVLFDVFSMRLFMYMCAHAHDLFLSPQPHMFPFPWYIGSASSANCSGKGEGFLSSM